MSTEDHFTLLGAVTSCVSSKTSPQWHRHK